MTRNLWLHFARHGPGSRRRSSPAARASPSTTTRARATSTGCPGCSPCRSATAATNSPRPPPRQAETLAFFPLWGYATPTAIELSERLARYAPGDLNRVFFTTGGTEAVETAWKVAKQYFKLTGKPGKHKVISRAIAYHGTTQGALAITGLPAFKAPFEPVTPGGFRVPNTNFYRAPEPFEPVSKPTSRPSGSGPPTASPRPSSSRGPTPSRAVFLEPVQNAGGCIPPPPGYFERVREICDEYDVLLVSDEVICAFGRIGSMFACDDFGYVPDMITCAKGLTSGYSPIGRDDRQRPVVRAVQRRQDDVRARLHLRRASGVVGGRAGQPRHLRARGPQRPRQGERARVPRHPGEAVRPADRRRRPRRGVSSSASNWSRTRRPSRRSPTRNAARCWAGCLRASSRPGCTAAPTTAAIPSSSWRRR